MLIWLGLVITEPVPIGSCPMHGSHAVHRVAAEHASNHPLASHGGAPKKASHQCTCIGDCSASSVSFSAIVPKFAEAPAASVALLPDPLPAANVVSRAISREHALPPANGPPAIS